MQQHNRAPHMGVRAIAKATLDKDDASAVRKMRHLIAQHGFPVHQRGRTIWAFDDEIDAYMRGNGSDK